VTDDVKRGPVGRVYVALTLDSETVALRLADVELIDVEVRDGCLISPAALVISRVVLVQEEPSGELRGAPMPKLTLVDDGLCFAPCSGGVRMRENRLARGGYNHEVAEAARFGMVNTLYHVDRCAAYLNGILNELGATSLPRVTVVVGAHAGSRLPGFAQGDGDYRPGGIHPLAGGHYRLSRRTNCVGEIFPVSPVGEIHLGPGRHRSPFAGEASYLRIAAHNPATIYHEFGHHLCRHTADFRLNAERDPDQQLNGKTGPEEGICDYLTGSLLGTGRPYGWYRMIRGERRDPGIVRRRGMDDDGDAHALGAFWAAALWRSRQQLLEAGLLVSPRDHDRAVVSTLLHLGQVARRGVPRRPRRDRAAARGEPETIIQTFVDSIRTEAGNAAADVTARVFSEARLLETRDAVAETAEC
jgi:hypothetical protein